MRQIVNKFIEAPNPKLGSQLTTMEMKYARAKIKELKQGEPKPAVAPKDPPKGPDGEGAKKGNQKPTK